MTHHQQPAQVEEKVTTPWYKRLAAFRGEGHSYHSYNPVGCPIHNPHNNCHPYLLYRSCGCIAERYAR